MLKIGITGGIGSGKSTVCAMLEESGIPMFYSDQEAHALFAEDDIKKRVIDLFGERAYQNDVLDRKWVGGIVFNDPEKLEALNAIMRPAVKSRFEAWVLRQSANAVGMESAILIESEGHVDMDFIIVVTAPIEVRIERAMKRDGATKEQIESRIAAQMNDEERAAYADAIIDNSGSLHDVRIHVDAIIRSLNLGA
jgi:dephospho-CoA kinase